MSSKRQKTQLQQDQLLLAFAQEGRSEAPMTGDEGTVLPKADLSTESPTSSDRLMESICDPANLAKAMAKVIANGGAPGVDGMRVSQLEKYFERHRERITGELLSGVLEFGSNDRRADQSDSGRNSAGWAARSSNKSANFRLSPFC